MHPYRNLPQNDDRLFGENKRWQQKRNYTNIKIQPPSSSVVISEDIFRVKDFNVRVFFMAAFVLFCFSFFLFVLFFVCTPHES